MERVIATVQERVPGFLRRRMTFEDFLAVCGKDGIDVEIRRFPLDEHLDRDDHPPRITLNAGLSESYRIFAGFHALAHWFAHPAHRGFYLGSPGWLDRIELEASAVGYLALAPYSDGAPYPRLVRARHMGQQMEFWVDYPRQEPGGRLRWKRRRAVLHRTIQMEFDW